MEPFNNQAGHPRDGAVVVYLNRPLPATVVTVPANFVRELHHDVWDILDFANLAPGSTMILPGRKAVAFLPSPNLVAGPSHTYVNNYRIDFSTAVTGIPQLIPSHTEFATADNFDTVGSWVTRVQPSETAFEVATDFAPVIDWSQPLLPSTITSANVTVIEQASGNPVSVTVYFDYDTNRMTLSHPTAFLPDAIYTVTLGTGFTNLMGKPLLNAFVWSFHTRPLRPVPVAGQGPYVTAVAPGDFSTNVDAMSTAQITMTFSEPMNDSTLTAATVHLTQHGAGTDVTGAFAYDSATKTLTFTPDASLDFATRYELTLDAAAMFSSATMPKALQGNSQFVFTTAPDPANNNGSIPAGGPNAGSSAGSSDPDQPKPLVLKLEYGDPDGDAGASVSLSITLPDGSQREQQMPNVTDDYATKQSPEIPAGSKVVVTPSFLKGSDTDPLEDESLEVLVNVSAATGSESAAQAYVVTIEQDGSPVQYAQLADGAAANANPQQKAVVVTAEMKLRATGKIEPAPENTVYANCKATAGGIDDLGPLPMGKGRIDAPDVAYTAPIQVIATVPAVPGADWQWYRLLELRSWAIKKDPTGTFWGVIKLKPHTGPNPDYGATAPNYDTRIPSGTGKLYIYDNSGTIPSESNISVGDFICEKKQFTYKLYDKGDGTALPKLLGQLDVGQKIIAKRIGTAGNVPADFQGVENSNTVRVLKMTITEAEVRAIVGGNLPIQFFPGSE